MAEHPLDLEPAGRQLPVASVVGLAALSFALVIFGVTQWQNSKTLAKIEHVQQHQATIDAARVPQTRISLCNGLRVAVAVITPQGKEQRDAIAVLRQNIRVLDCPPGIERLPPDPPHDPP